MAMMPSGRSGNQYDDDHAVLDEDFLNDGELDTFRAAMYQRLTCCRSRA